MKAIELDYAALTIDSNVFIRHGLNLERGLLGQLQQFSLSPVKLVISEVVFQEVRKHLLEATRSARSKLQDAFKAVRTPFGIPEETLAESTTKLLGKKTDAELVEERLDAFLKATGAVVIEARTMEVNQLLRLYFEKAPPFEAAGAKKAEFPDAIALLSLDQWARDQDVQLLAVSNDSGWLDFAKLSNRIDAIENLADALTHFQPHNSATNIIEQLKGLIATKAKNDVLDSMSSFIVDSTNETEVDVQYSSALHAELDVAEVQHESHEFLRGEDGRPIVDVIRIEADWLSLRLRINIHYRVLASFSMEVWDSIDKEYIPVGSASTVAHDSHECDVLLSLTGDFSKGIDQAELGELGIDLKLSGIDVGDVEPNVRDD